MTISLTSFVLFHDPRHLYAGAPAQRAGRSARPPDRQGHSQTCFAFTEHQLTVQTLWWPSWRAPWLLG